MAAPTFIFLIVSAIWNVAAAQTRGAGGGARNITRGSSLTPTGNSSWISPSGHYAFGFYPQGNGGYAVGVFVAGIPDKTVVWTANRDNPPPATTTNLTLQLTADGRLILQSPQEESSPIDNALQNISAASMLDTGNFVLYNSDQEKVWESFEHPTDTILPGQTLSVTRELVSAASETDHASGIFRLKMQSDRNLVQYPVNTPDTAPFAYWSSGIYGTGDQVTLNLDNSGRLYLFNSSIVLRNITQGEPSKEHTIIMMRLDSDGIFRLYSHSLEGNGIWSVLWQSTTDKCDPKGICGLNGFCVLNDGKATCSCLPGFDFVDPSNSTSGCVRNFIAQSCKDEHRSTENDMKDVENVGWGGEDNSYLELSSVTKEECKEACLKDCNCEATVFENGKCRKLRLPLKYGRMLLGEGYTATTYVKVGTSDRPVIPMKDPEKEIKKETRVGILITGVSLAGLALVVVIISGLVIYRNRIWVYRMISEKANYELGEDVCLRAFTFFEMEQITNGFKHELGRGSSATVFKGIIPYTQKVVAVKRLENMLTEGEREFHTEVKVIGKTHHRNLVRLIGYCIEGANRLLVYDYMINGSLANLLFTARNQLNWDERIGIALDIARGILYLHEECETQIIHYDIKPHNILMDENMIARIIDFGLAKLLKPDQTKTFTGIRGTKGYVAPEWHRKLPVTVKADVYSFGIVLLEIICCRSCLDWSLPEEEAVLEEWVYDCFEAGELGKLIGDEEIDKRKLERMVKVGLWCIQDEPSLRPSMKKVVLMLEGTVDIPTPPSPTSFLSTI
ncbi:G-type lectin S-receptor-like serine/threonine-protein kinase LECRK3 isoform X2 [Diospyros lotus]|uniref:G-type lectin S-receptor-like serine/threonine-protein kinase LECRK3 isoform X2 n=1 Tax=Diospyros lotus TaxID=55363 RepID=UPI00224C8DE9|nr:G-type lectin S-receptor-like serine/threonine-protein kinase LECRK3 isoform X2 [Diospyros lotus]